MSNNFISPEDLGEIGKMVSSPSTFDVSEIKYMQGGKWFQYPYLLEFLSDSGIQAAWMVIEWDYISRTYLSDYQLYYSRCFQSFTKTCKRVHFFTSSISKETLLTTLSGQNSSTESLQSAYLGYIVVKPISFGFAGATLLKPYSETGTNRVYPVTRDYSINLYGIPLTINTLAFQAQDRATTACASIALWSAFQKTAELFQSASPTPSEITLKAGNLYTQRGRNFPSHGLSYYQLGKAIESVGLVSELRNRISKWNPRLVRGFIYAYLKLGLPVLMGIDIEFLTDAGKTETEQHLITATGYKIDETSPATNGDFALISDGIHKLYVHDDQLGPFSRLGLVEDPNYKANTKIVTGWPNGDELFAQTLSAKLDSVVVPLYHKIRIPFEEILRLVEQFHNLLQTLRSRNATSNSAFIWDLFLDEGKQFKSWFRDRNIPNEPYRNRVLYTPLPRFVWRARYLEIRENRLNLRMELLFDATDVPNGNYFLGAYFFNEEFRQQFGNGLDDEDFHQPVKTYLGKQFLEKLVFSQQFKIAPENV